jgi:hypothetical protein
MSQVPQQDKKKITLARVKRTEAYAEQVRVQFATTVNEILALYKTMPELDEGEMYSFDGENLKKQKEVERLLRQLHAAATVAIERGIKLEWAAANADCDKLFTSCFGKAVLSTPQFTADAARNNAAMQAFLARSDRGLNLSQRVWKSVEQLRDEMEVSMTVAIGEGESASSMSRKVRKYLNDPDLCFRRFRYKAGEEKIFDDEGNEIGTKPVYGKKWKKRVRKADGSVGWIDYDKDSYKDEWTGRGYYKSSAQNAMRVARTETNIAYRRADNERWQQLDFVLGQRIELSKQHPKKDICDKLAGDYPKDFIFDGWHPQCFCFVTPILMDESEMKKATEAFARGETYTPRGKVIRDYPEGFKSWVRDNAENIAAARERGTEPYFIRNNAQKIDEIIDPSKKQLTALERAAIRHENRTPEQEEAIKLRWQEREQRLAEEKAAQEAAALAEQKRIERINSTANLVLSVVSGERFAGLDIDTSLLEAAINSGDTDIINTETRALAQLLSKKQQLINKTASNVTKVAAEYNEVDASALQAALASKSLAEIQTQTKLLAQQVSKMKQAEASLETLIPNAHEWHKQFTLAELQGTYNAIEDKLAKWSSLSLEAQAKKLKFEAVDYLGGNMNNVQGKYSTWKVSQAAYLKKLDDVNQQIALNEINTKLAALKTYLAAHPKAVNLAKLIQDAENALTANSSLNEVKNYITLAEEYKLKLETLQAKRDAKKKKGETNLNQIDFDDDTRTQQRKDAAKWFKNDTDANDFYFENTNTREQWRAASADEKKALYEYTHGSSYITEPLRAIEEHYYAFSSRLAESKKDTDEMTNIISRCYCTHDVWIKRDEGAWCAEYRWGIDDLSAYIKNPSALVGRVGTDESFMSCGNNKSTYFGNKNVLLNIYCPKKTRMIYAEPFSHYGSSHDNGDTAPGKNWNGTSKPIYTGENEIILQRGTKLRITKAEYTNHKWYIDCEVLSQYPRPIDSFVSEPSGYYVKYK